MVTPESPALPALRFGHNGITVSKLQRSVDFYTAAFGLVCLSSRTVDDAYIKRIVQVDGTESIAIAFIGLPCGQLIVELLEYRGSTSTPRPTHPGVPGTAHLCLMVDDIESTWDRALSRGGRARSPQPVRIDSGPYESGFGCYLNDPDGYTIELLQAPLAKDR